MILTSHWVVLKAIRTCWRKDEGGKDGVVPPVWEDDDPLCVSRASLWDCLDQTARSCMGRLLAQDRMRAVWGLCVYMYVVCVVCM